MRMSPLLKVSICFILKSKTLKSSTITHQAINALTRRSATQLAIRQHLCTKHAEFRLARFNALLVHLKQ